MPFFLAWCSNNITATITVTVAGGTDAQSASATGLAELSADSLSFRPSDLRKRGSV